MRIAIALVVLAHVAEARGSEQLNLHVDLASGKVTQHRASAQGTQLTFPLLAQRPATVVRDGKPGDVTIGEHIVHVGTGIDTEWMPWSVVDSDTAVFDWREIVRVAGKSDSFRDVVRGFDLATGQELWRRDSPANISSTGAQVGDHLVAMFGNTGIDIVDVRTGKVLHPLGVLGAQLASAPIDGGDTLVDTGDVLARIGASGATIWKLEHLGQIDVIAPFAQPATRFRVDPSFSALPASGDWIVLGQGHLVRIDSATGRLVWSVPAGEHGTVTRTGFLIDGNRIAIADLRHTATSARVRLFVRDIATGTALRDVLVYEYKQFSDFATAEVLSVSGDKIEIVAGFGILD